MPYKNPELNRAYQREWKHKATEQGLCQSCREPSPGLLCDGCRVRKRAAGRRYWHKKEKWIRKLRKIAARMDK